MVQTPRDQYMERIAQLADEGRIALFIGAGVSEAANAPSSARAKAMRTKGQRVSPFLLQRGRNPLPTA